MKFIANRTRCERITIGLILFVKKLGFHLDISVRNSVGVDLGQSKPCTSDLIYACHNSAGEYYGNHRTVERSEKFVSLPRPQTSTNFGIFPDVLKINLINKGDE